jgi:hypothetical protein
MGGFPLSHSSWCLDAEGRIVSVDTLLTGWSSFELDSPSSTRKSSVSR